METIQKNSIFSIIILMFCLFVSCDKTSEFNEYKTIQKSSWKANKKIIFEFEVKDTVSLKNLFINIRNNNDYQFSNLYLISELNFPNGTVVVDTLQYEMTDKQGFFLGSGFTEVKDNKLFYKERKKFPVSGIYTLSVRQAMRKNGEINPIPFLAGISDVGFSIEKIEE
ncbi:gliding motility lipoprotein GldH [Polaribacter sp. MSW13]|uniref:Gliding motility lipoprotein GldH n=1 Tax=Polaribacter marinus TaxID=2916838 RepID=A0A9X1VLZ2_9FLAO|nr:gliding motility lipoprotein GldH [Polaribacter marinus]MCI2228557.1 gliding motility lipoprotein GldH [Polaribacter marinus]